MERGSNKHGPMLDDQMEKEVEDLERATPRSGRADEFREKEGPAEDEPTPDSRISGDRGLSRTEWLEPSNLEWRNEVQRYIQGNVFPAQRDRLLASAEETNAPDNVKDLLRSLSPDKTYGTIEEIWLDLGGDVEGPHM